MPLPVIWICCCQLLAILGPLANGADKYLNLLPLEPGTNLCTVTLPVTSAPAGNSNNLAVPDAFDNNVKLPPAANVAVPCNCKFLDTLNGADKVLVVVLLTTPITTSLNVAPLPDHVWLAVAPVPTNSKSAPVPVKVPLFDKLPDTLNKVPALMVKLELFIKFKFLHVNAFVLKLELGKNTTSTEFELGAVVLGVPPLVEPVLHALPIL